MGAVGRCRPIVIWWLVCGVQIGYDDAVFRVVFVWCGVVVFCSLWRAVVVVVIGTRATPAGYIGRPVAWVVIYSSHVQLSGTKRLLTGSTF